MQIPRHAERQYIALLGIAAVYIASLPDGRRTVCVSTDLLRSRSYWRREGNGEIEFVVWVKDRISACSIRRLANRQSGDPRQQIRAAARALNIPVTEHAVVMDRVCTAIRTVDQRINAAHHCGELKWFNQAFRDWRLNGHNLKYRHARSRLRDVVIKKIVARDCEEMQRALLPEIFY
jgi:hypothetical protein